MNEQVSVSDDEPVVEQVSEPGSKTIGEPGSEPGSEPENKSNINPQIYIKKDFSLNPKCLILSTMLVGLYSYVAYNPANAYYGINPLIFVLIYLFSYVGLAWYDEYFECRSGIMQTGVGENGQKIIINPDSIFKPRAHDQPIYYQRAVYTFHLLMVAPLMMYIGYYGLNSSSFATTFLGGMGIMAALYHGYMLRTII